MKKVDSPTKSFLVHNMAHTGKYVMLASWLDPISTITHMFSLHFYPCSPPMVELIDVKKKTGMLHQWKLLMHHSVPPKNWMSNNKLIRLIDWITCQYSFPPASNHGLRRSSHARIFRAISIRVNLGDYQTRCLFAYGRDHRRGYSRWSSY